MKKVDKMSINDMERYFYRVDRLKATIGQGYRLFWPFNVLTPYVSPTAFILDLAVLMSWFTVLSWLLSGSSAIQEGLVLPLAWLWGTTLVICFFVGLVERHIRIRHRYLQLTRSPTPGAEAFARFSQDFLSRLFR